MPTSNATYLTDLRDSLARILASSDKALVMGEDISDPYGGAFKVTQGLSSEFPNQVLHTPISEQGFVGVATGLAYMGHRPIVELMFGDFLPLIVDPVINTASKLGWWATGGLAGSVLVRAPVGGGRGYGPIHSQSLEQLLFGWPGVEVYAPGLVHSPGLALASVFDGAAPVKLFIEHKLDYPKPLFGDDDLKQKGFRKLDSGDDVLAGLTITNAHGDDRPDVVIACYGGMATAVIEAAFEALIEDEITCAVHLPIRISPFDARPLQRNLEAGAALVLVEEGYLPSGWTASVLGSLVDLGVGMPLDRISRVGPDFKPIPAARDWEEKHLPQKSTVYEAIQRAAGL